MTKVECDKKRTLNARQGSQCLRGIDFSSGVLPASSQSSGSKEERLVHGNSSLDSLLTAKDTPASCVKHRRVHKIKKIKKSAGRQLTVPKEMSISTLGHSQQVHGHVASKKKDNSIAAWFRQFAHGERLAGKLCQALLSQ